MSANIKKIKDKIAAIKTIIKKQGRYGYYLIDGSDVKLVNKGHDKQELEDALLEKISEKKRYVDHSVYFVDVHINEKYIGQKKKIAVGPVSLRIMQFRITNKFKLKHTADLANGTVWYADDDVDRFHFTDIKKIVHEIDKQQIEIISTGGIKALDILNDAED
jgi:hypothetical protein